jgi:uncharacterized protein (TIGR02246 family)
MIKLMVAGICLLLSYSQGFAQQAAPAAAAPKTPAASAPVVKAKAKPMNDEAGIKNAFEEFSQAWAAADAKKLASFWVKDGSLINPFGQDAWNREDVEKLVGADTQLMKGSTQTFSDFKFRFILNFALVDCTATLAGMKNPDGTDAPSHTFHIYGALAQRDNRWYILALRPYSFVPLPGAAVVAPPAAVPAVDAASTTPGVSSIPVPSTTPSIPLPGENK